MRKRKKAGPIESLGDGAFRINLADGERETMLSFVDQLEEVLAADQTDPRLRRLLNVGLGHLGVRSTGVPWPEEGGCGEWH